MKKLVIGFVLALSASLAHAAGYEVVSNPQPPRTNSAAVEVEAVFWYGCPFCYQLEPKVKTLETSLAGKAEFIAVPAPMNAGWAMHARLYHVAKSLNVLDRAHGDIFERLKRSQGRDLSNDRSMISFFGEYGISRSKVMQAAENPAVVATMKSDLNRLNAYGLRQVPAIIVDGKYLITPTTAGGVDQMIEVAKERIEFVRKSKPAAK